MKAVAAVLIALSITIITNAQTVNVGDVKADAEETTIQIKKGKSGETAPQKPKFEITDGEEDVVGDGAVLVKEAKANWKKACKEWKAELKENNKGNQVLSANCGNVTCGTEQNETVCRSSAKYKLKVRMDD